MFTVCDAVFKTRADIVEVVSAIRGHDYRCCKAQPVADFVRVYKGTDVWREPVHGYAIEPLGNQLLLKIIL